MAACRWCWALLLCAGAAWAVGDGVADLYNQGNARYRAGDFEDARRQYLAAVDQGGQDPRLLYNLGNACFKGGHLGEAAVWWERALRLDPRDDDVRANLQFLDAVKQDREGEETNALWAALAFAAQYPTVNELCVVVGLLVAAGVSTVGWHLWRRGPLAGAWRLVAVALAVVGSLNGAWLVSRAYQQGHTERAVITVPEATARSGPDGSQTAVFVAHEATRVQVARYEGAWVLVRLGSGLNGWLPAAALTRI